MIARRYHAQQKAARAAQAAVRRAEDEAWERAARQDREPVLVAEPAAKQEPAASDKQRHQPRR